MWKTRGAVGITIVVTNMKLLSSIKEANNGEVV